MSTEQFKGLRLYIPDDRHLSRLVMRHGEVPLLLVENSRKSGLIANLYEDVCSKLSDLHQQVDVGGEHFNDVPDQPQEKLINDERDWLLPFVMAVLTYRQESRITVGGTRFSELTSLLKSVNLAVVASIEIKLLDKTGSQVVSYVSDYAVNNRRTTILIARTSFENYEILAPALQMYLEIQNAEFDLRYAFARLSLLSSTAKPGQSDIIAALTEFKIYEQDYLEVSRALSENHGWLIERITVYLRLRGNTNLEQLSNKLELNKGESLDHICSSIDPTVDWSTFFRLARGSGNELEFVRRLHTSLAVEFGLWNQTLREMDKPVLINEDLIFEFQELKSQVQESIQTIFRLSCNGIWDNQQYSNMKGQLRDWHMPEDWKCKYWSIEYELFRLQINALLVSTGADQEYFDLVLQTESVMDLNQSVSERADRTVPCSAELIRENSLEIERLVNYLQRIMLTLVSQGKIVDMEMSCLNYSSQDFLDFLAVKFDGYDYLESARVTEEWVFVHIFQTDWMNGLMANSQPHTVPKSLDDVLMIFSLSDDMLVDAKEEKMRQIELRRQKRRTIEIGNTEFDTDEDNLFNLWATLNASGVMGKIQSHGSISQTADLKPVNSKKRNSPIPSSGGANSRPGRIPKHIENTIGITGEMIVYSHLLQTYPSIITPESWRSENSRFMFRNNRGDDSLGYDFEFVYRNKKYHIEVKATRDTGMQFEMGSSETRRAREEMSKRNVIYIVALVQQVFVEPVIHWIPNPFSKAARDLVSITEVGARVRVRL
jgi:hypothetical protein